MATLPQIKAIHTLKSQLYLDDETYKENLSIYGVTSSKDLSKSEATELIKAYSKVLPTGRQVLPPKSNNSAKKHNTKAPAYSTGAPSSNGKGDVNAEVATHPFTPSERGIKPNGRKKYYGKGRAGFQHHITPGQAERIAILEGLLGWNSVRTTGFIKRMTRENKAVQMLMNYQASKIIVGMQRILSELIATSIGDKKEAYKMLNEMTNNQLQAVASLS